MAEKAVTFRMPGSIFCLTLAVFVVGIGAQPYTYTLTKHYIANGNTRVQISITSTTTMDSLCAVDTALVGSTYNAESVLATKSLCCVQGPGTTLELDFVIDFQSRIILPSSASTADLTLADCGILTVSASQGKFQISVRSFADPKKDSPSDTLYVINIDLPPASSGNIDLIFPLFDQVTNAAVDMAVTYDTFMEFRTTGYAAKTGTWLLGDEACLQATLVVNPYQAGLDYVGMRLHTCYFTEDGDITGQTAYIGANGCSSDRFVPFISENVGWRKISSSLAGTQSTYTARFPCFDLFTLGRKVRSSLTVTCALDFCLDDSDFILPGQCGGLHCNPNARRRRNVANNSRSLSATINFGKPPEASEVHPCTESPLFRVLIGILLSVFVALAICILVCVLCMMKRKQEVTSEKKRKSADIAFADNMSAKSDQPLPL